MPDSDYYQNLVAIEKTAAATAAGAPLTDVAATVTVSGALVVAAHNPVNAVGGACTMSLVNAASGGLHVSMSKTDSSVNTVTVSGNIRGVASTISLWWQHDSIEFLSRADGSWWPIAGHKTKAMLDAAYLPVVSGVATLVGGAVTVANALITASSVIRLSSKTVGGTPGARFVSAQTAGVSFVISSTSGADTSVVQYEILSY